MIDHQHRTLEVERVMGVHVHCVSWCSFWREMENREGMVMV